MLLLQSTPLDTGVCKTPTGNLPMTDADPDGVQYTQTDTIRQTDGPLVPMVPIEKGVIPMVLLVNMHLIKGTLIIFPCDLAGYRAIPMVHWYQWYDWYQWKMMPFQWFYWSKTSSPLHQVETR